MYIYMYVGAHLEPDEAVGEDGPVEEGEGAAVGEALVPVPDGRRCQSIIN